MTKKTAAERYKTLLASALRLGTPGVTDGTNGRTWLDNFMDIVLEAGYRVDFIPVHYYKTMSAANFYAGLKDFMMNIRSLFG